MSKIKTKISMSKIKKSKINPFNWQPKTRKTLFVTAISIVAFLVYRFYLYPNSEAILKAIGLRPDAFISAEVYGALIQSGVTAFTIYATFKVYERSKRDTLSQKVYDKKFETYCLLWEKMQEIEKQLNKALIIEDTSQLRKQIYDFHSELQSKYLLVSETVGILFSHWVLCALWHLDSIDVKLYFLEYAEEERDGINEDALYFDKQRGKFRNLIAEAMKKELGLEKLEAEINLSVDNDLTEEFNKKVFDMMNKVIHEKGHYFEGRDKVIELTKKHLTKNKDQSRAI